jgi:antitoxin YefM
MHKIKIGEVMYKIQLDQDIQPLSEFRSKVAFYFDKVKRTKRPLIITQNGKSSAILLDVSAYQSLIDKLEVLEDIKLAEEQISQSMDVSHQEVKKKFAKRS